jgi:hypothetical protein
MTTGAASLNNAATFMIHEKDANMVLEVASR